MGLNDGGSGAGLPGASCAGTNESDVDEHLGNGLARLQVHVAVGLIQQCAFFAAAG